MEEDDIDFTPSESTSSNLASLFGFTKKPLQGNPSLTYVAPKPPKKESSPLKNQQVNENSCKAVIIYSKAVQAYKLENRTYVSQGLAGIVISGSHKSCIYAIILYKPSKEHLSKTTITKTFGLTISANNCISFYDNNKQNWSVRFESAADIEQFAEKALICKFYCYPEQSENILIQDTSPPSNNQAYSNSSVEIIYSTFCIDQECLAPNQVDIKEKINLYNSKSSLAKGLIGCSENCKRIVIIPHSLCSPLFNDVPSTKNLLLRINVIKITSELESALKGTNFTNDVVESPSDSSTEESNSKVSKACSKEDFVSAKTHKANLISRMAKMGQVALPLKPVLGGPSDSEDESYQTSSPKSKGHKNRMSNTSAQSEAAKQVAVYQNDLARQQALLMKYDDTQKKHIPVSVSPTLSPTADPILSVYVSESRIQATELRMGISKLTEKIDHILNKVNNLNFMGTENKIHQSTLFDSNKILSSIQNIIMENESLKEKVKEQKEKMEQQNDRIFHLLELNQKHVEQNSASLEKQSEMESKLRKEIELSLKKEIQLEADANKYLERVKSLEEELEKSEEVKRKTKQKCDKLTDELDSCKKIIEKNDMKKVLEDYEEKMAKTSEFIKRLKDKLKEVMSEKETLKGLIESYKANTDVIQSKMEDLKVKNREYEMIVESLKNKIIEEETKSKSEIDNLKKIIEKLQEEKNNSVSEIVKQDEIKKKTQGTVENLQGNFEKSEISGISDTVPEAVSTAENTVSVEGTGENNAKKDHRASEINAETSEKYKNVGKNSYDQGWRTTKPPPPFLFDDDDDDDCDEWFN